jgi:hypothetical protein
MTARRALERHGERPQVKTVLGERSECRAGSVGEPHTGEQQRAVARGAARAETERLSQKAVVDVAVPVADPEEPVDGLLCRVEQHSGDVGGAHGATTGPLERRRL